MWPKVGKGAFFQIGSHLGAVQKVKTNPETPPALQGSSETLKGRPGSTGLVKPERPLRKCLRFTGSSSEEWGDQVGRGSSKSKFRTTIARVLASQQRLHTSSVNSAAARAVTVLHNLAIKSFGQSNCKTSTDQHRTWNSMGPRRGLSGNR